MVKRGMGHPDHKGNNMTQRIILFVFAGRQPNLELQRPMVQRILDEHPNVEYHVWNFAREHSDRAYVETIPSGPQVTVFNEVGSMEHWAAWQAYAEPEYQDCLFVKMDDDIVFLETHRFGKFIEAIDTHRGSVLTANIINNGACTPVEPGIWKEFNKLGMHLLDIHLSSDFANMTHGYFFDHHADILNQPIELVPSTDWLSINIIGYDWLTHCKAFNMMGTPHPAVLAGRPMNGWGGWQGPDRPYGVFGCEGTFNTMTRIIMKGFTAAHLTYGPQNPIGVQLKAWRKRYAEIGQHYLDSEITVRDGKLPRLSPVSAAQGPYTPPVSQPGNNNGALVMVNLQKETGIPYDRWHRLKLRGACCCTCASCAIEQDHCLKDACIGDD